MAFVGRVNIHPMSNLEQTLHNMVNEQANSLSKMIQDIQTIHEKILPFIQLTVPEVVKIKIKPDRIEG